MRLGIDFGTTRTVVAGVQDGRHPLAAFDDHGEFREYVPGIAALRQGTLLVGWEAARAVAAGTADHSIRSVKRVCGALAPDAAVPGLPGYTALELATAFLAGLRAQLVEHGNLDLDPDEPLEVLAAVPASAPSRQRWLTLEALRRAGFQPLGLLNEPTAAAIDFAHRHLDLAKKSAKRYVVVYDLGGGTFDTSAVSLEGRRFELLATEGLAQFGGDDFDELILEVAGAPRTTANLERAREAKEGLRSTTRKLHLDLGTGDPIAIDTAELYLRAQPLIDRSMAQIDELFERLGARGIGKELGGLYLVGGGAAFPAVARTLRARFAKKLQLAPQPFAATAIGLAIAADPAANVMIREALTRHFGVWREADAGEDKIFDALLGKASPTPLVVERRYHPAHAVGHLRFLECGALDASGQPIQDVVPWTDVYFPYDPALADREADALGETAPVRRPDLMGIEIAETYTVHDDGTISVQIANLSRGYARTYALGALR